MNTGAKLVKEMTTDYRGFTMSLCFATANGDIGYIGTINMPVREPLDAGSKIRKGWLATNDWKGYIPSTAMPFVINPAKGFVSCSNQRIASDHINYRIGGNGFPMARAVTQTRFLRDLITKGTRITSQHMMDLQSDLYDSYAADALPLMLKIAEPHLQAHPGALSLLKAWDFRSPADSIAVSIYYSWENRFLMGLLGD